MIEKNHPCSAAQAAMDLKDGRARMCIIQFDDWELSRVPVSPKMRFNAAALGALLSLVTRLALECEMGGMTPEFIQSETPTKWEGMGLSMMVGFQSLRDKDRFGDLMEGLFAEVSVRHQPWEKSMIAGYYTVCEGQYVPA